MEWKKFSNVFCYHFLKILKLNSWVDRVAFLSCEGSKYGVYERNGHSMNDLDLCSLQVSVFACWPKRPWKGVDGMLKNELETEWPVDQKFSTAVVSILSFSQTDFRMRGIRDGWIACCSLWVFISFLFKGLNFVKFKDKTLRHGPLTILKLIWNFSDLQ